MRKLAFILLFCLIITAAMQACGLTSQAQPPAFTGPTPTSIAGWEKFEARGVELWLPESFEGGDPNEDPGALADEVRKLGSEHEEIAEALEQNSGLFVLWAFDTEIGPSGELTTAAVTTEFIPPAMPLENYLDMVEERLPEQFELVEQEPVTLENFPAGRLIVAFETPETRGKEALYVIKDGDTIWILTYGTAEEEFDERLAVFEQSAETFAIKP